MTAIDPKRSVMASRKWPIAALHEGQLWVENRSTQPSEIFTHSISFRLFKAANVRFGFACAAQGYKLKLLIPNYNALDFKPKATP
ncbi:hypothetical protein F3J45_13815 [Pantoea sp. Ap-967]|uniref:hypothetical protein n=1 Tax=Pantoea sp. Ap-967 TaxID=2608362 RepID=UPI00141FADEB|nr:hypothetical protein [Pantoea sp. Ap-967]NIE75514.1 hypothetical protein [Pantoea sp. Ap-967]